MRKNELEKYIPLTDWIDCCYIKNILYGAQMCYFINTALGTPLQGGNVGLGQLDLPGQELSFS